MPIYEYECRNCNESFEKMVSFSDADKLPECPNCMSMETHKIISVAASFTSSGAGVRVQPEAVVVPEVDFPEVDDLNRSCTGEQKTKIQPCF